MIKTYPAKAPVLFSFSVVLRPINRKNYETLFPKSIEGLIFKDHFF